MSSQARLSCSKGRRRLTKGQGKEAHQRTTRWKSDRGRETPADDWSKSQDWRRAKNAAEWWGSDWEGHEVAEDWWGHHRTEEKAVEEPHSASPAALPLLENEDPNEIQVAGKSWLATQAFDFLREFILGHRLDSFTREEYLHAVAERCCFIEEGTRLLLNFPACCPRLHLEEILEEPGSLKARQKLAAKTLTKLHQEGFIGDDLRKSTGLKRPPLRAASLPWKDIVGSGGEEARIRLPSHSWKEEVSLYAIKTRHVKSQLGFLSHVGGNFCYSLTCQGRRVLVEAVQVSWDCNRHDLLEHFNQELLSEYPECTDLRLVKMDGFSIDFEGMEMFCKEGAKLAHLHFLREIAWKLDRLAWWETVRKMGPAEPAPSPLKLHVIFDCHDRCARDIRETLAVAGEDALRLLAVVASSEENPTWSREQLEARAQEFLDEEVLAELAVKSKLPQYGERKNIGKREAREMLLALIGSYGVETDMFAVTQLWKWLTGEDTLRKATFHTSSCPKFQGRTPGYLELSEIDPLSEDSDPGATWLKVRYEDYDDCFYRWHGRRGEELRLGVPGSVWQALIWDPVLLIPLSPSMLLRDGRHRPLPNKVCAWIRGYPIKKLVTLKHPTGTPEYTFLREEVDELGENDTRLLVEFTEHEGHVVYRRSTDGGLGYEIFQMKGGGSRVRRVGYSETNKRLLSQVLPGWPLPKKIVSWLLDRRCLADIVAERKKTDGHIQLNCGAGIANWTSVSTGRLFMVRSEPVGAGVIYTAKAQDEYQWQALTYSEEQKVWLVTGETPEVVPSQALSYLSQEARKINGGACDVGSPVDVLASRNISSQSARILFPHLNGATLVEIEEALKHRFTSPRLLSEALTHVSAKRSLTTSCERLAVVGHATICSFTSEFVLRRDDSIPCSDFSLTGAEDNLVGSYSWPAGAPRCRDRGARKSQLLHALSIDDAPSRKALLLACCNHTSFAFSCIKLGLHKAINPPPSGELREAIDDFSSRVNAFLSRSRGSLLQILGGGAPKVLGDVFLASIGAIVMDSDLTEVEDLLEMHTQDCSGFMSALTRGPFTTNSVPSIRADLLDRLSTHTCPTTIHAHSVVEAFSSYNRDLGGAQASLLCSDVALVEVDSRLYLSTTPQAALVQAAVRDLVQEDERPVTNAEKPGGGPEKVGEAQSLQATEHDGAIYCRACDKWMNGPTQWADHEIGKRHRKAFRKKMEEDPPSDSQALSRAGESVKKVPVGFGKRPQEHPLPRERDPATGATTSRGMMPECMGSQFQPVSQYQ